MRCCSGRKPSYPQKCFSGVRRSLSGCKNDCLTFRGEQAALSGSIFGRMQIQRSPKSHDVIIIGSVASGAMTAWNLTRMGVNVLVLDAGTKFQRSKFWTHVKPWEWRERVSRGQHPPQFELDRKEQPYTWTEGQFFDLVRVWGRGGKTNIWG